MARERILSGDPLPDEDESLNISLRPNTLDTLVGQRRLIERLRVGIDAAKMRDEPIEHVLFHGPPGLGKTTLAHVIANEMGSTLVVTSGPALVRTADLMGILTNLQDKDVLFIDEIHRLPASVEEYLYPAMEDRKIDFVVDSGAFAKTINVPVKAFTLIGATTRSGLVTTPLRQRFGIDFHVDFWPEDELQEVVRRSAGILDVSVDEAAVVKIARCARGTPRVANRLLNRVRDYAQAKADGRVTLDIAEKALEMNGVDAVGLEELDRKFIRTIIDYYDGGPVGIEAIAATLNEEADTLEAVVEPYLLKIGFVTRTSRGRKASDAAYKHLGLRPDKPQQGTLF